MIYKNVEELIGNTPLVELTNIEKMIENKAHLFAKVESFNPGGSIKDRIALKMLNTAIKEGKVKEDTLIIEPTSGNTGIGLCMLAASKGLKAIIVMPDSMSVERIKLMKAYGAEVILTPGKLGMKGAIAKANELHEEYKNSFIPSQFENPNNPLAHYLTTGKEIYDDLNGNIDILVAGIGTGGTISGIGKYLKEHNPNIKVIGVEPEASPVLSEGKAGPHKIQGIGAGFIPNTLNTAIYDEIIKVSNENAFEHGRLSAQKEGLLVGISSGAALCAAIQVAKRDENKGKNIVVIFPDTGERYLSSEMFN